MSLPSPDYLDAKLLRASARARVYEATRERDGARVVAKVFDVGDPAVEARVEHEFRLVQRLAIEGVVRAIGLERNGDELILLFEHVPGMNLEQYAGGRALGLDEFLAIATSLAKTLAAIHDQRILHRDIKPSNLLYQPTTGQVMIADFGISVLVENQRGSLEDPDLLEGTLPYISPEQTGRTKRAVDFRSDLYSLGASFYELLTGVRPFTATSPIELIHAHLARRPRAPRELDAAIPERLSAIVLRLLEKAPEHRYQTARGLHADLVRLVAARAAGELEPDFVLGERDHSTVLQLPHRLYGRVAELALLERELELAHRDRSRRAIVIAGEPGLGKSALVHAFEAALVGRKTTLTSGKFDLDHRALPYQAFVRAFSSLVEQLLTRSEASLARWRVRLHDGLGSIAGALVELVPNLGLVLGELPPLPAVDPSEARNRLQLAISRFIDVFAKRQPLVLVLDDLQWADGASLELLRALLAEHGSASLVLLLCYRRDEVGEHHPLLALLRGHALHGRSCTRIELGPLTRVDLEELLADVLARARDELSGLAELVGRKTEFNPLFIRQFLLYLAELGLLQPGPSGWTWDERAIAAAQVPDDVLGIMAAKLARLPERERRVLQVAACIGSRFGVALLEAVAELRGEALASSLYLLDVEGLISPVGPEFQFSHDRIQEAARDSVPVEQRREIHWAIGRHLLALDDARRQGDALFTIVDQLAAGLGGAARQAERKLEPELRRQIAALARAAGERAFASAAWSSARRYFGLAIELVAAELPALRREGPRASGYAEIFAIHFGHAQALAMAGEHDPADAAFLVLLSWPLSTPDYASVVARRTRLLALQGRIHEALATGLEGLRRCEVRVPEHPSLPRMILSVLLGWRAAGKLDATALEAMPEAHDERESAAMNLVAAVKGPAFVADPNLFVYLTGLHARMAARVGFHPTTTLALAQLASAGPAIGKAKAAGELCDHALALNQRRPAPLLSQIQAESSALFFVWPSSRPFRELTCKIESTHQRALETGDLESAGYIAALGISLHLDDGSHLREVVDLYQRLNACDPNWGTLEMAKIGEMVVRFASTLIGDEAEPAPTLMRRDELESVEISQVSKAACVVLEVTGLLLLDRYELAHEAIASIDAEFEKQLFGTWQVARFAMLGSVAAAERAWRSASERAPSAGERRSLHAYLRKRLKVARRWAAGCPANYAHHAELIAAELAALRGEIGPAYAAFERARALALEHRVHYVEALACLRMAAFATRQGHLAITEGALRRGHAALRSWGAKAALRRLELDHAELAFSVQALELRETDTRQKTTTSHASSASSMRSLDASTLVGLLHAIGEELQLDEVITRVLSRAIEHAGADFGALLLDQQGVLGLVAETRAGKAHYVDPPLDLSELGGRMPTGIIHFVLRTGEAIVVDDAASDARFASDPYVLANQLRSLLCMPIVKRGRRVGALLLANHLGSHAFTNDRLELLAVLINQAANALDNARLYDALQRSEAQWRSLVTGVPDIISLIDDQGAVEFVNHLDPYDAAIQRVLAKPATIYMTPSSAELWRQCFAEVMAQAELREIEIEIAPPGLPSSFHLVRLAPITVGGRIRKVISISTDISERRNAAAQRAWLEAQLRQQQRLESIGTLASGVAHEINNPVQGIMNYAELIDERANDPALVREFAAEIGTESQRVATIVRHLLSFSRQDLDQALETTEVRHMVDATLSLIRSVLRRDMITLDLDLPAELWPIRCRSQQIQQIVMNLVTNARDAMNDAGVLDEAKRVRLSGQNFEREGKRWVRISIEDRGGGIPDEIRGRIFDPFFTTKRKDKGTGLGLAVSHGIAAEHGGALWVESVQGVGATFHLDLPVDPSSA